MLDCMHSKEHMLMVMLTGFEKCALVNRAMIAEPRHPLMLRVLHNIVDELKNKYLCNEIPCSDMCHRASRCSHGYAQSTRACTASHQPTLRLAGQNFAKYGGRVKSNESID